MQFLIQILRHLKSLNTFINMRAKNEFKFIAEAYNTKLILERVVDGTLMCPEACCGAPVMECKCGPDCPHCNCHEIQKLAGKDKTIKEFYKMRDPDGDGSWPDDEKEEEREKDPNYGEPAEDAEAEDIFPNSEYGRHLRREAERHEQEDKRVRLALDSPGYAAVQLPKGHPNIQKYLDKGYKIVKDYKKAEQAEDNEEAGRAFATPELKRKDKQRQMWAKRKERWDAWKKKQARSEDNEVHLQGTGWASRPPPVDEEDGLQGAAGHLRAAAARGAVKAGAIHKPYVSSFVSDGGKIFGVMGSDGKIVHKTRDKRKAYKWFRDNYENI